jgi:predicted DNA-binding mobile mystery protein A
VQNKDASLEFQQLNQDLASFRAAFELPRPQRGWIQAVRQAKGVSTGELGRILGTSRQLPLQFEKAEADDTITLKSLRKVADALDCDLVYALLPRSEATPIKSRLPKRPVKIKRRDPVPDSTTLNQVAENTYFCD